LFQLVLRNREDKQQKPRIVLFVGSPVEESEEVLKKLGNDLRRNNVSIDIVSFGETEMNHAKLDVLLTAANKETKYAFRLICGS
jgi:26S proteasome regulatory subunit N10